MVVSLYRRRGQGADRGVPEHLHDFPDDELDPADVEAVLRLAEQVASWLADGQTVLLRCQAGLNRSPLVAALAPPLQ